ncbi:MAG: BamA/TamA family outer membrane protein [Candidatus Eisenbacteria bacterium]
MTADRDRGDQLGRRGRAAGLVAVALMAAGIALATVPARAQDLFGQNKVQYRVFDWRYLSSDHFDVYYYGDLDSLALRVLDLAEKANGYLSVRMGHQLSNKVPIILYGSHNEFSQTNVTQELLTGSTGGFTEVYRNRVVLPFTGSYEDLRHVVVHELTHAFMFDMLYNGAASSMIARQAFFAPPLWFAEGMAEYYSLGLDDPNMRVYVRDGALNDQLPPLEYAGGYVGVYKQGQAVLGYLVDRFGEDRLREMYRRMRSSRDFDAAFQRVYGTSVQKFDEDWRNELKTRYWPLIADKYEPDRYGRRLTDHRRDESNFNTAPAISPQGDRIVYYSDRRQYTDVYLMSAFDGRVIRRLIRGEQDVKFESVPSFRSSLTWSPEGGRVAMTAKSGGRDLLYVVSVDEAKLIRSYDLGCEALAYPSWSPVADSVVVVGLKGGRSDLYMVALRTGDVTRLTNDTWDERQPSWTPDGRALAFSSDRVASVVLQPQRTRDGYGYYGLYSLDLASREVRPILHTAGDDQWPAWSNDGRKLAFISDARGTPDVYLYDTQDSTVLHATQVMGGVQSLSWSRENDRIVFSVYDHGGFDVFTVREPLSLETRLARLRRDRPQDVLTLAQLQHAVSDTLPPRIDQGALAGAWPDTLTMAADTLSGKVASRAPPETASRDTTHAMPRLDPMNPTWAGMQPPPSDFSTRPDTLAPLATRFPLHERGGPFAISDTLLAQKPSRYRVRYSADYAGGSLYATNVGALGATQVALSDFLGDRRIDLALGLYSNSLSDANVYVAYNYLPRRTDVTIAAFHYKEYFESRYTSLGEQFSSDQLYSDRNFGGALLLSYPFNQFRRVELGLTQRWVDRTFFVVDDFGNLLSTSHVLRSVTSPSIGLIFDNALYGYYGPVNGTRYNITYSPALPLGGSALSYQTATLDWRRYIDLTHGYQFARRFLVGYSDGPSPQYFRIGGFSTLRGYSTYSVVGSRIGVANVELRFPFIQQLGLVGPLPIGIFNMKGALFSDVGTAFNGGYKPRGTTIDENGNRRLQDILLDYGVGIRTSFLYTLVKLDVAWRTDLQSTSRPVWQFSIGPEL